MNKPCSAGVTGKSRRVTKKQPRLLPHVRETRATKLKKTYIGCLTSCAAAKVYGRWSRVLTRYAAASRHGGDSFSMERRVFGILAAYPGS